MRLPVKFMRDTLTLTLTTDTIDPLTGAGSGTPIVSTLLTQPCSLQQVRRNPDGSLPAIGGVQTETPAFRCYTAFFPSVTETGVEYRVNGVAYPLARRINVAGQSIHTELHFGQPQGGA